MKKFFRDLKYRISDGISDRILDPTLGILLNYKGRLNYVWQHKKAYLKVEKKLTGKNTLTGYLHDADKLVLYILGFPTKLTNKLHKRVASHHEYPPNSGNIRNIEAAVIDWACVPLTRPDRPLNARQTWQTYYPNVKGVEPVLTRFGL